MNALTSLERLTSPQSTHRAELVTLVLDQTLARPWGEVVDAAWITDRIVTSMALVGRDDTLRQLVTDTVAEVRTSLAAEARVPRDAMPDELVEAVRTMVGQPWSPSEEMTFRLINHGALRSMLREVLTGTLTRFANKARSLDDGVLGGLGGRAVKRSRGFLGGGLTAAAGNLVGAVRDEVEAAVEGRVKDHVKHATEEAIRTIARWVANPAHADMLAAMRVSAVESLLDTPTQELAKEFDSIDESMIIDLVWSTLRDLAARPDLAESIAPTVERIWGELAHQTLGSWLDQADARESWMAALTPVVDAELQLVMASEEFSAWWQRLHSA